MFTIFILKNLISIIQIKEYFGKGYKDDDVHKKCKDLDEKKVDENIKHWENKLKKHLINKETDFKKLDDFVINILNKLIN